MTLQDRSKGLNRPVRVTVTLTSGSVLRLRALMAARGLSLEQAVEEAVGDWAVRGEGSLRRDQRLGLEAAMRRAMTENISPGGLTPGTPIRYGAQMLTNSSSRSPMELKARRLALNITRRELAELADCSEHIIRAYEGGLVPQKSAVLPRLDRVLSELEMAA